MFRGTGRGAARFGVATLAVTATTLALASSASGATLKASYVAYNCCLPAPWASYIYTGAAGERNDVTIRLNEGTYVNAFIQTTKVQTDVFGDSGALIQGPSGPVSDPYFPSYLPGILCVSPSPLVVCNADTYATFISAALGDGNDRGKVDDGGRRTDAYPGALWVAWNGGPGDDVTGGGTAPDNVVRQDTVASPGADTVLTGGARFTARTTSQSLTLDGVANDGEPGENDNLSPNVLRAEDGEGASVIVGSDIGQTWLNGNGGNDQIDPKGGADTVHAGDGDDTITISPDGAKDVIECGAGTDTVTRVGGVDPLDQINANCENVS